MGCTQSQNRKTKNGSNVHVTETRHSDTISINDSESSTSSNDFESSTSNEPVSAIGIDLGTSYSCVGVFRNGKVEIIPNEQGNRLTPSYVAFTDRQWLIGDEAKNRLSINPQDTVFHFKRLIGRKFSDSIVQSNMKRWPFKVINDYEKPKIEVKYKNQIKQFTPEEISSMILIKMKHIAESYLGHTVTSAVITVPASFNDSQRQSTRDAATIAGLKVLRLINESTAAAIAYGLDKQEISNERNILIYDLGGGTFNVSVISLIKGIFEVKSTTGDGDFGGEDCDKRMVKYFVEEFRQKNQKNLSENKHALRRLLRACEHAKVAFRDGTASIEIDSLHEDIDFYSTITRARFEELNDDLFYSTLESVKHALHDAKMNKSQIHEVILVGGSTRIPKVQKILQDFFNGKQLNKSINPDEAVAYGAAIQAAILTKNKSKQLKKVLLFDVTSHSLGIESADDVMTVVVERNTILPLKRIHTFTTSVDFQQCVAIKLFQGERSMTKKNHLLGTIDICPITPALKGAPEIQLTFDIDVNGILNISAVEKIFGKEKKVTLTGSKMQLSKDELERMINDAKRYQTEDEIEGERLEAKNLLRSYCFNIKTKLNGENLEYIFNDDEKKKIIDVLEEISLWLEINQFAKKEEFEHKLKEAENALSEQSLED
ncbi:unnamed protein product [Adineta steineri]|uniref:Uncharacterized protein n=1 Tax=Adineta steineri TaxID=433720 RepID=A0A813NLA5_9BILA|nr:unnamed protein product [Adineta steineri]CAF0746637.1 unnamed protein product [Adineta steineri]